MHLPLLLLPSSALLLEGLLLWRLSRHRLAAAYPYLTVFVAYDFLSNLVLFPVNYYKLVWFAGVYWRLESISIFLRFLIAWEFFRAIFAQRSALRDVAWKVLVIVELGVLPAILLLSWRQTSSLQYLYLRRFAAVEQYFSLAQALVLLAAAAVALYYRLPLNRNLRGLGFGFGIYLLVRAVNFASVQIFHQFFSYLRLLTPFTLIGMIAVWLWAFWDRPAVQERLGAYEPQNTKRSKDWQVGPLGRDSVPLREGIGK